MLNPLVSGLVMTTTPALPAHLGEERELNTDGCPSFSFMTQSATCQPLFTSSRSRVIGSGEAVHAGGIIGRRRGNAETVKS